MEKLTIDQLLKAKACNRVIIQYLKTPELQEIPEDCNIIVEDPQLFFYLEWVITNKLLKIKRLKLETLNNYWEIKTYNDQRLIIKYENSNNYWKNYFYNNQGLIVRYENSNNYWENYFYNDQGLLINLECSEIYEKYSGNIIIN